MGTTTMSDRCEPPPELRHRDGWHWMSLRGAPLFGLWTAKKMGWTMGGPEHTARLGYRYLAPVPTPAEIEALRAENERLRAALEVISWSEAERDGMALAFAEANKHHGHYESLFAVAAFILRHRAARAALEDRA